MSQQARDVIVAVSRIEQALADVPHIGEILLRMWGDVNDLTAYYVLTGAQIQKRYGDGRIRPDLTVLDAAVNSTKKPKSSRNRKRAASRARKR